jgi:hypothetical protein
MSFYHRSTGVWPRGGGRDDHPHQGGVGPGGAPGACAASALAVRATGGGVGGPSGASPAVPAGVWPPTCPRESHAMSSRPGEGKSPPLGGRGPAAGPPSPRAGGTARARGATGRSRRRPAVGSAAAPCSSAPRVLRDGGRRVGSGHCVPSGVGTGAAGPGAAPPSRRSAPARPGL